MTEETGITNGSPPATATSTSLPTSWSVVTTDIINLIRPPMHDTQTQTQNGGQKTDYYGHIISVIGNYFSFEFSSFR